MIGACVAAIGVLPCTQVQAFYGGSSKIQNLIDAVWKLHGRLAHSTFTLALAAVRDDPDQGPIAQRLAAGLPTNPGPLPTVPVALLCTDDMSACTCTSVASCKTMLAICSGDHVCGKFDGDDCAGGVASDCGVDEEPG
jgi:hypothetical protein